MTWPAWHGRSGACFTSTAPPTYLASPAQVHRVYFLRSATTLALLHPPSGIRSAQADVLEAEGVMQAASGDTLALRLGSLRTASEIVRGDGRVVLIPTAQIATLRERRFQAGTTALAGFAALSLAGAAFIVLIIVVLTQGI